MGRRTRGILMILLGLALTFAGARLYARYDYQAKEAGMQAYVLLQEVKEEINAQQLSTVVKEAPQGQMPQAKVDNHGVIGILEIPEAAVQLPVMNDWSYEQLEYGPCRYSGSLQENNLVLMGHNYAGHLANLDQLEQGDLVKFVDVTGQSYSFSVAETAVISPDAVDMVEQADYPLTVFTCTPGGQNRYVVYCQIS